MFGNRKTKPCRNGRLQEVPDTQNSSSSANDRKRLHDIVPSPWKCAAGLLIVQIKCHVTHKLCHVTHKLRVTSHTNYVTSHTNCVTSNTNYVSRHIQIMCHVAHKLCHVTCKLCFTSHTNCHVTYKLCHVTYKLCHVTYKLCHVTHKLCVTSHTNCHITQITYNLLASITSSLEEYPCVNNILIIHKTSSNHCPSEHVQI